MGPATSRRRAQQTVAVWSLKPLSGHSTGAATEKCTLLAALDRHLYVLSTVSHYRSSAYRSCTGGGAR